MLISVGKNYIMENMRKDNELPVCTKKWGWKFHHIGIPTNEVQPNEKYIRKFKLYTSGFTTNPFGVELMRYENDSPIDMRIQTEPHLAFLVNDLDYELKSHKFNIITPPNAPSNGVRVAMIEYDNTIIELIEFK